MRWSLLGGHGRSRTADQAFAEPCLNHLATWPTERETGFEPATFSLARRRATTAPLPRNGASVALGASTIPYAPRWCQPRPRARARRPTLVMRAPVDRAASRP